MVGGIACGRQEEVRKMERVGNSRLVGTPLFRFLRATLSDHASLLPTSLIRVSTHAIGYLKRAKTEIPNILESPRNGILFESGNQPADPAGVERQRKEEAVKRQTPSPLLATKNMIYS